MADEGLGLISEAQREAVEGQVSLQGAEGEQQATRSVPKINQNAVEKLRAGREQDYLLDYPAAIAQQKADEDIEEFFRRPSAFASADLEPYIAKWGWGPAGAKALSDFLSSFSEDEGELGTETAIANLTRSLQQQDLVKDGILVGDRYISAEERAESRKAQESLLAPATAKADQAFRGVPLVAGEETPILKQIGEPMKEMVGDPVPEAMSRKTVKGTFSLPIVGDDWPLIDKPTELIARPLIWLAETGASELAGTIGEAMLPQVIGDAGQIEQNKTIIDDVNAAYADLQRRVVDAEKERLANGDFGGDFSKTKELRTQFAREMSKLERGLKKDLRAGKFGDYSELRKVDDKYAERVGGLYQKLYSGDIGDSQNLKDMADRYEDSARKIQHEIASALNNGDFGDGEAAERQANRRFRNKMVRLRSAQDAEIEAASRTDKTIRSAVIEFNQNLEDLQSERSNARRQVYSKSPDAILTWSNYTDALNAARTENKNLLSVAVRETHQDTSENRQALSLFRESVEREIERLEHQKSVAMQDALEGDQRSLTKYYKALWDWGWDEITPPLYVPGTSERVGSGEWLFSFAALPFQAISQPGENPLQNVLDATVSDADDEDLERIREERKRKELRTKEEAKFQSQAWLDTWRPAGELLNEHINARAAYFTGEISIDEYNRRNKKNLAAAAGYAANTTAEATIAAVGAAMPTTVHTEGEFRGTLVETPTAALVRNVGGWAVAPATTHIGRAAATAGFSLRNAMPTDRLPTYAEVAAGEAELERLASLYERGLITREEFDEEKAALRTAIEPGLSKRLGTFAWELMDGWHGIGKVAFYGPLAPVMPDPLKLLGVGERGERYVNDMANQLASFKGLYDEAQSFTRGSAPAIDELESATGLPIAKGIRYTSFALDTLAPWEKMGVGPTRIARTVRAAHKARGLKVYGVSGAGQTRDFLIEQYPWLERRLPEIDPEMQRRIRDAKDTDAEVRYEDRGDYEAMDLVARDDAHARRFSLILSSLKDQAAAGKHTLPENIRAEIEWMAESLGVSSSDLERSLGAWMEDGMTADSLRDQKISGPERDRVRKELAESMSQMEAPADEVSRSITTIMALLDHQAVQSYLADPERFPSADSVYGSMRMSSGDVWVPTKEKGDPLFQRDEGIVRDPSIGLKAEMRPSELGRRAELSGYIAKAFVNRKTGQRSTVAPIAMVRGMLNDAPPSVRNEAALLGMFDYLDGLEGRTVSLSDVSRVMDDALFRLDEARSLERGTISWIEDQDRIFVDQDVLEGRYSVDPYVSPLREFLMTEFSFTDANGAVWKPRRVVRSGEGLALVELEPPADYINRNPSKRWAVVSNPGMPQYTSRPETKVAAVRRA